MSIKFLLYLANTKYFQSDDLFYSFSLFFCVVVYYFGFAFHNHDCAIKQQKKIVYNILIFLSLFCVCFFLLLLFHVSNLWPPWTFPLASCSVFLFFILCLFCFVTFLWYPWNTNGMENFNLMNVTRIHFSFYYFHFILYLFI